MTSPTDSPHMLATFTRRRDADRAAGEVERQFPRTAVTVGAKDDALDAMTLGQRVEMDESLPMLGIGLIRGPLPRGALLWGLVGVVVGAAAAAPFSLIYDGRLLPRWQVALFFALAGALACSSATFVLGAARQAVNEGETTPEDPTAVVRVDVGPDQADPVLELLTDCGARQVRYLEHPVLRAPSSEFETPRGLPDARATSQGADPEHDAGLRSDL